jgi:hypothetical protein
MIAASNVQNLLHGDLVQYHMLLRWLEDNVRERLSGVNVPTLPRLHGSSSIALGKSRLQRCDPSAMRWSPSCHTSSPWEGTPLLRPAP